MKLEDGILICTREEYNLVKKYNCAASPWMAGLCLYHGLKNKGIATEWNAAYFKDVYLAFRRKNVKIIEANKDEVKQ